MVRLFSPFMRTFAMIAGLMGMQSRDMMPLPTVRHGGRRGPARSPGKGIHITPNNTGWWRRHAAIQPMVITERMLMRHGWYRRQLRTKGVAIDPGGKNSMVLR